MDGVATVAGGVGPHGGGPGQVAPPCDDIGCCNRLLGGALGNCAWGVQTLCIGPVPDPPAPYARNGMPHAVGINFCSACEIHEDIDKHNRIDARAGTGQILMQTIPPAGAVVEGARADLCDICIPEEMKLYWQRIRMAGKPGSGTPGAMADPATTPTLQDAEVWPTAAAPVQDLCICKDRIVRPHQGTCCHACRDKAFYNDYLSQARETEDILRLRKEKVINGEKLCDINGGTNNFYESVATVNARVALGIGRKCPCGNQPDPPQGPAAHYIDICLACSGVRVNPANIPNIHQQLTMFPANKRETRNHPTKGPEKARRAPEYRVNIEHGWRSAGIGDEDPWIADR